MVTLQLLLDSPIAVTEVLCLATTNLQAFLHSELCALTSTEVMLVGYLSSFLAIRQPPQIQTQSLMTAADAKALGILRGALLDQLSRQAFIQLASLFQSNIQTSKMRDNRVQQIHWHRNRLNDRTVSIQCRIV